jgi:hypothetical protein
MSRTDLSSCFDSVNRTEGPTRAGAVSSIQCAIVRVPTRQRVGAAVPAAPSLVDQDSVRAIVPQKNQIEGALPRDRMNLTAVKVVQQCLAQEFFRDLAVSAPRDLRQYFRSLAAAPSFWSSRRSAHDDPNRSRDETPVGISNPSTRPPMDRRSWYSRWPGLCRRRADGIVLSDWCRHDASNIACCSLGPLDGAANRRRIRNSAIRSHRLLSGRWVNRPAPHRLRKGI